MDHESKTEEQTRDESGRFASAEDVVDKVLTSGVRVDQLSRRDDNDALEGLFVDVVDGEHAGRRGVFDRVLEYSKKDGYPTKILVRSRDERDENLVVSYKDARPVKFYGGGR